MAAIAGKGGAVLIPVGAVVTLTNTPTTANTARTVYTITDPTKRALDRTFNVTVETSPDGVTWSAASGFRVVHAGGQVIFSAAQAVGTQIRVSGKNQPMVTSGQFQEWSLDLEKDLAESTVLGSGWKNYVPTLKGGSGSLAGFWADGYWIGLISQDAPIVLWLDVDGTNRKRYQFYANLTKNGVGVKVSDLVSESVDFTVDGEPAYYEG